MGYSSPFIQAGRLYAYGVDKGKEVITALDVETGKRIWRSSWDRGLTPQATPVVEGDCLYVLGQSGALTCLATSDGRIRWRKDLVREYHTENIPYGYSGSPVIEGDLLLLNVNTAGVALDKATGTLVWASKVHTEKWNTYGYHATPVLYDHDGRRCALLFSGTGLFSVDVATGRQSWFFEWFGPFTIPIADPVVSGGQVLISSYSRNPSAAFLDISGNTARALRKDQSVDCGAATGVLLDGYLYAPEGPGAGRVLRCVDWKTGEVKWQKIMKESQLIAAGGMLVILDVGGTLRIARASSSGYEEVSSCQLPAATGKRWWSPPVFSGGRIICRNFPGDLVCIDVRTH